MTSPRTCRLACPGTSVLFGKPAGVQFRVVSVGWAVTKANEYRKQASTCLSVEAFIELKVPHFQNHIAECRYGVPFVLCCFAATSSRGQPKAQGTDALRIASASSALIGGPIGVRSWAQATLVSSSIGEKTGWVGTTCAGAGTPSARMKSRKEALSCTSRMRAS